jgi:hypothetical protein
LGFHVQASFSPRVFRRLTRVEIQRIGQECFQWRVALPWALLLFGVPPV